MKPRPRRTITSSPTRGRRAHRVSFCLLLWAGTAAFLGCSDPEEQAKVDESEIRVVLEDYLPQLAEAYATGNIELLREHAAEKELASIDKLVGELADQGRVLKPELRSVTIESIHTWSRVNAYVTTLEVWDIYNYALGSETVLSQSLDKAHRVKYQMKRRDEGWQILYRQVQKVMP